MPPEVVETSAAVWWLRQGWLLVGGLVVLLAVSVTIRRWGVRALGISLQPIEDDAIPSARTRQWDRFARGVIRFLSNTSLIVSTIAVVLLFVATCWPSVISPYNPEERGKRLQEINGEIWAAPFPPSAPYPLGSDLDGRDMLSRILHGTKSTMTLVLSVALMRLAIGGYTRAGRRLERRGDGPANPFVCRSFVIGARVFCSRSYSSSPLDRRSVSASFCWDSDSPGGPK